MSELIVNEKTLIGRAGVYRADGLPLTGPLAAVIVEEERQR